MKLIGLIAACLFSQIVFAQQKITKGKYPYNQNKYAKETCIYNKDNIFYYVITIGKFYSTCDVKDKDIYTYEIYGKIVNRSNDDIKVTNADIYVSNFYLSCKKKGDEYVAVARLNGPIYLKAKSEKTIDFHAMINLVSEGKEIKSRTTFSYELLNQSVLEQSNTLNNEIPSFKQLDCGSIGFMDLIPGTPIFFDPEKELADTSFLKSMKYYKSQINYCPENYNYPYILANTYFEKKERADANWLRLAIQYYNRTVYQMINRADDSDKIGELWLLEVYWKLGNLYEYAGMYEPAIVQYNKLKKYTLDYIKLRESEILSTYKRATSVERSINYSEEATAHIIVCRFLMKNRPANITATLSKDTVVTTAMLERMDFSDQAIQQRSGFEPIKQMVEEVEKKQNYKTKDPNIKGKVIDMALMALGWAIAPKDMKVEQRNQFIMGTLSTVISLIDKDKVDVSAGGLSSSGMASDLADLKTSLTAKNAEAAFNKVQPSAKATAAAEAKKVETAGGVTITDKWEVPDISGEYKVEKLNGKMISGPITYDWSKLFSNSCNYNYNIEQNGDNITFVSTSICSTSGYRSEGKTVRTGKINNGVINFILVSQENSINGNAVNTSSVESGKFECEFNKDGTMVCNLNVTTTTASTSSKSIGQIIYRKIK